MPEPVFRAVLECYARTVPTQVKQLEAAAAAGDFDALGREAHDLRGFCGNLGAERVVELTYRLATACKGQDASAVASLVPDQ